MSKSSDPRNFFESDAQQLNRERRKAKSTNKYGNPIILKSKVLAAIADPRSPSSAIFIAESAGSVRRIRLADGDTKTVYRGPSAPVTCVAIGGPEGKTLFAGSWDRTIWSWDIDTREPGRKYTGHTDFVKAVVCATVGGRHILISGGADKRIIVWDMDTGRELHVLQDVTQNMMAVQDLAVDPVQTTADEVVLLSASSDPHIRQWRVRLGSWEQAVDRSSSSSDGQSSQAESEAMAVTAVTTTTTEERRTILEHDTSVYRLVFDHASDEVDLWTASADGTSKCLPRAGIFFASSSSSFSPGDGGDVLAHGDHVKAVALADEWVVTAGRDENLKFWSRASGELHCSVEGHFDEVTDLVVLRGRVPAADRLCSVSIDGTVRTWPLGSRAELDALAVEQRDAREGRTGGDKEEDEGKESGTPPQEGLLSPEEEAELAALMEDD